MSVTLGASTYLEAGDHLTREEFHRRYLASPRIKKAELVEGVVYVPSPVRFDRHAEQTGALTLWLGTYAHQTPGVRFGNDGTIFLDEGNEPQPDALLWRPEPNGPRLTEDGYLEGAPQLVVEVAASSGRPGSAISPVVKPSNSSRVSAPSPFGARSFIREMRRQRLRQPSCDAQRTGKVKLLI